MENKVRNEKERSINIYDKYGLMLTPTANLKAVRKKFTQPAKESQYKLNLVNIVSLSAKNVEKVLKKSKLSFQSAEKV